MKLDISYRGELSSCNYDCAYCPFAKTVDSRTSLKQDAAALERFTDWLQHQHDHRIDLLFTPWGEALVRSYYRQALVEISHFDNIHRVAIQTNLSTSLTWLKQANHETLRLWTTYHPGQTSRDKFIQQSHTLVDMGIRHSVGIVGEHSLLAEAQALKAALHPSIYLWVNAFDDDPEYYHDDQARPWQQLDRYFHLSQTRHASLGKDCAAATSALLIKGDGNAYPCHFIDQQLGNIYRDSLTKILRPMQCCNDHCNCYIGYRHLKELQLEQVYGEELIARIAHKND